jgi:DNA primase small subunit
MIIKAEEYLTSKIKEYYEKTFIEINDVERYEFGYGVYNRKIANRNIQFKDNYDLNEFLRNKTPFYLSKSIAKYEYPEASPTTAKNMLESDFMFEFDADDIPTACKKIHDSWFCEKCGAEGKGHIMKCPECNYKTKLSEWICDKCLDATKKQTKRLIKILIDELGFKEEELSINFSGHKGYHIYISSNKIKHLKKNERLELIDYISESGLNFKEIGFVENNKGSLVYKGLNYGKGIKYLNLVKAIITDANSENIEEYLLENTSKIVINKLLKNKLEIITLLDKNEFYKLKTKSEDIWYTFLEKIKEKQKLYIDKQTTIDIYKILRVPNTIHGGAMLLAKTIELSKLDEFNPFEDAKLPSNEKTLKIHLKKVPKLLLNRTYYGPYNNEIVELPYEVGLYLVAKGAGNEIIL